jgi:membrane-bound lytic murein transglycosylase D
LWGTRRNTGKRQFLPFGAKIILFGPHHAGISDTNGTKLTRRCASILAMIDNNGCIMTAGLVHCVKSTEFPMTASTVIILLIVGVLGVFGCAAPTTAPLQANQAMLVRELPATTTSEVSAESTSIPSDRTSSHSIDSSPVPLPLPLEITEETLALPVPKAILETPKRAPVKVAKTDDVPKIPAVLSLDDAEALQKAPGPRADNRLLDLLERDLDKAVEKPTERRRLELSKEVSNHPKVRYFIDYFSRRGKPYFEKILARSGKYMPMIAKVLSEEGLPEELAYLALIESAFLPHSTSTQGAAGLWQFVPSTARLYGLRIDSWIDERRDPEKSTRAAAAYLKELHAIFGRWYLATAAYNAGPGAIDRAMQQTGAKDFWTLSQKAQLSEETRNFVPKFVAVAMIATNPEKYGFTNLQYESPLEYEEIEVSRPLRIGVLAEMAETDVATIRALNPALMANATPPGGESFALKLPVGKSPLFAKAYDAANERTLESQQAITHEVKRGETLFSIARRYGQEVGGLMRLNGLTSARLYVGQQLKVLLQSLGGKLK